KARGVTVRVISDEEKDYLEIEHILIEHGIPITWHDTRWFTANHNKGIIADGKIVLVSSINYSDNSIENNREAGVIIENEDVAQWFLDVYDFDWGIADGDAMNRTNLHWEPNLPTKTDTINVTVYGHRLYSYPIENVTLGVKIGSGSWVNHSITWNNFTSSEGDLENYFYEIAPQPSGTNITVQAFIQAAGTWYDGVNMTIHVLPTDLVLDGNPDTDYELGTTGHSITWSPSSDIPDTYIIWKDNAELDSGNWNGSSLSVNIDGLEVGSYNYTLRVNDTLGEAKVDTVIVSVADTVSPTLSHPADQNIMEVSTGNTISWTIEDLSNDTYQLYQDGVLIESGNLTSNQYILTSDIDGLAIGEYNFTVVATDLYENTATDEVEVTVYDGTSPILNHPDDITVDIETTGNTLSWTATDIHPDTYSITMNGELHSSGDWVSGEEISINLDNLASGEYTFVITVTDESGNTASDTVLVTVPLSNTQILIAAAIGIGALVVIGIVCWSKRK
ncbi:MAG: phospholipase D-like domain-containing protein, partial [Candidatus Thorarchaeota archaeon]